MVFHRSLSSVLVSIENQITSVERHLAGFEKVRLVTVTGKVPGLRVNKGSMWGGCFGVGECHFLTSSPVLLGALRIFDGDGENDAW